MTLTEEEAGVIVSAVDVLGRQMAALYDLAAQLHFASKVRGARVTHNARI